MCLTTMWFPLEREPSPVEPGVRREHHELEHVGPASPRPRPRAEKICRFRSGLFFDKYPVSGDPCSFEGGAAASPILLFDNPHSFFI